MMLSICIFLFSACDSKKSQILNFKSPDNNLSISVSGEKPNLLDPWMVNIELQLYKRKVTKSIEYHSGTLDETTVKCVWKTQNSCELTFEQQDDTKRIFYIEGNPDGYTFKDIGDVD